VGGFFGPPHQKTDYLWNSWESLLLIDAHPPESSLFVEQAGKLVIDS